MIIGVLVAISIPIFTSQLKKARLATNQANARAAYATAVAERLDANATGAAASYVYDVASAKITGTPGTNTGTANSGNIQAWTKQHRSQMQALRQLHLGKYVLMLVIMSHLMLHFRQVPNP